jgi:alginate O-acetyltransferase complex protein AlgI
LLFNSYEYLCVFLPLTLGIFLLCERRGWLRASRIELVLASLFFYSWWNPSNLPLLLFSLLGNFQLGRMLSQRVEGRRPNRWLLPLGVSLNLGLLAYFKYAGFLTQTVAGLSGSDFSIDEIVLPLAISFFTFQQIAYLVDASRGIMREASFLKYSLFVCFFPQLIAGPIVHHLEMMPQFDRRRAAGRRLEDLSVGLAILVIGLFKKVILADNVAVYATPVFAAADSGASLSFFEAWGGVLAYSVQIYFDFSGYSDMAIGSARLFGIRLPLNFASPYKSSSLIDFWRRWHMTLSRFLRDYLYFGLGGNRRGPTRRHANLLATMFLGGLWHGAGWSFVLWGSLHGLGLVANHGWRALRGNADSHAIPAPLRRAGARGLTYLFVVMAWVVFRAETMAGALRVYEGMLGRNGLVLPGQLASLVDPIAVRFAWVSVAHSAGLGSFPSNAGFLWIVLLTLVAVVMPNTQQWLCHYDPALGAESATTRWSWQPTAVWGAIMGLLASVLLLAVSGVHEFLYFQF